MQKAALIAPALTGAPTVGLAGGIDDALVNTVNAGIDRGIASVQAKLPLSFGPGITITSLRREGRTIIYTMDFQPPPGGRRSTKAVDNLRESLTKRVCADNGKSWFDLGYVTKLSVWDSIGSSPTSWWTVRRVATKELIYAAIPAICSRKGP
jgi:hypothetical protein